MQRACAELDRLKVPYTIKLDPTSSYGRSDHLFASASAADRAAALHELAQNHEIGAIIAVRGGAGALELLPLLDFELLRAHPKAIIGLSDTTVLLISLLERAGWAAVHGPCLDGAFALAEVSAEHRVSAEHAISYLRGNEEALPHVALSRLCGAGDAHGSITGGNLSMITSLLGTPWAPKLAGQVLFLEEVGERPYRVQRMLQQLAMSGLLASVSGVLLGNFLNCEHPKGEGPSVTEVLMNELSKLSLPVFGYLPAGHGAYNLSVPFGRRAVVSEGGISFDTE
jgi:muramoyltetrapeptide carboxypeptidase